MARQRHSLNLEGQAHLAIERKVFADQMRVQIQENADTTTVRLATAYARAWKAVSTMAAHMANQAAEAKFSGRNLSPREIARLDRVDKAQFALEHQIRELGKLTGIQVSGGATRGLGHFTAKMLDQLSDFTGVDRRFTAPAGAAMEGLISRSTGQIEASSRRLTAQAQAGMKDALFRGLVLGENPNETAKFILKETKGEFFGGLARAKTIARTEIADAHRFAARLAYNQSDFVVGWKWMATLGPRTCPACWALHNTFHQKTEVQFAHQNCRCTMVPVLVDDLDSDVDLGDPEAAFWDLPREEQEAIMGPGRLKALEGGAPFSSLAFLKHNPEWRPAFYATSVKDLTGLAELSIASTPGDLLHIPGQSNESILSAAFKSGGLTIQAGTGEVPTSGIAVAQQAGAGIFDAREFFGPKGPQIVADWMTQNGDALDSPTAHMGVWWNHADGKVYLDVVDVIADRDAGIALGKSRNQIAVFDLATFDEIPTGGDGKGGPVAESLAVSHPDIGRGVKAIVPDRLNGPTQADARIIDFDPATGKVTVKAEDGFIYDVQQSDIVEFTTPANTKDRIQTVQDITAKGIDDTGLNLSFSGADPVVAQQATDALRHLTGYFPDVKPSEVANTGDGTAYATTFTSRVTKADGSDSAIAMNRNLSADAMRWKAAAKEDEESRFHPAGSGDRSVEFTLSHEYGHVLDFALFDPLTAGPGQEERKKLLAEVFTSLGQKPGTPLETTMQERMDRESAVEKDLSKYGAHYGDSEMIAEAVGAYLLNGPGKSIVADTVMRGIVRRYQTRFGHRPNIPHLDELMEGK